MALWRRNSGALASGRLTRQPALPVAALRRPVAAGVLATVVMDAAMVTASAIGGDAFSSARLSPEVMGRWSRGLLRGRWRHADILSEPPRRGEAVLGMLTHYTTGVALTAAFLAVSRRPPTLTGSLAYGVATSVLPLLVMFPSMGYGCFGVRSGEATRLNRIMLLGHAAFGVGIGLSVKGRTGASG